MFGKGERARTAERLDQVGRAVVRAAAGDERAVDAVASSGFLYARVRARIAAERALRESGESWMNLLAVARRAVPAMALSAIAAFGVFWFGGAGVTSPQNSGDEVLLSANESSVERVLFAERDALSSGEVFETIVGGSREGDESEAAR